jgi:hypothetical protein
MPRATALRHQHVEGNPEEIGAKRAATFVPRCALEQRQKNVLRQLLRAGGIEAAAKNAQIGPR